MSYDNVWMYIRIAVKISMRAHTFTQQNPIAPEIDPLKGTKSGVKILKNLKNQRRELS